MRDELFGLEAIREYKEIITELRIDTLVNMSEFFHF